jgi:hypothetical protein
MGMRLLKRVLIGCLLLLAAALVAAAQEEVPPMVGTPEVPEPGTWMLTVTGLGILALMLRRRRK